METPRFIGRTAALAILGCSLMSTAAMRAQTLWDADPATPGNWTIATNWSTDLVPDLVDAYINNGGVAVVNEYIATSPNQLRVGTSGLGGVGPGTLELESGGDLFVQTFVAGWDSNATVNMRDGSILTVSSTAGNGDGFAVGIHGAAANFERVFNQFGGTINSSAPVTIGVHGAAGTYNLSGGILNTPALRMGHGGGGQGTAVLNISGGTLNNTGELQLGWGNLSSTLNLSDTGAVNTTARVRIGVGSKSATLNQSGGTLTVNNGTDRIDIGDGSSGGTYTYNLTGGTVTAGQVFVGAFGNVANHGVFIVNGESVSALFNEIVMGFSAGLVGDTYLEQGTVAVNNVRQNQGTGTLHFSGGTLLARQTRLTDFIAGVSVDLEADGGVINSDTHTVGIASSIKGVGGLTKIGAGTLTLAGDNTYTGNTTVSDGFLTLSVDGELKFAIGGIGVSNRVQGTGTATFDGTFVFDMTNAAAAGEWTIVDTLALNETYGASFTVRDFQSVGGGLWTKDQYTFSQLTGVLTAVPEPSTFFLMLGGLGMALGLSRRRLRG